jgi:phage FluMu protein Com
MQNIQFTCPKCNQTLQATEDMVGNEIRCPECNQIQEFARYEHGLILVSRDDDQDESLVREMTYPAFARECARGVAIAGAGLGRNVPRWMGLDRFLSPSPGAR